MTTEAFAGLRVLDLTQGIAGPYCTKWFADFGADVIKIEPPGNGDAARASGPFPGDIPNGEVSGLFLYLNSRKKSVTLDLDSETGQQIVRKLAAGADLLFEDAPPGSLPAKGLGYDDLRIDHPDLVYVSITNFGQTGPYRDDPATDLTLAAASGTMNVRALAGRQPIRMGGSQSHYIAGRSAFISAMGALLFRDATGEGQWVDVSSLEAAAGNDMAAPTSYSYQGVVLQPRRGPAVRGRGGMGRYPCKDGWVDVLPGVGGLKKLAIMLGDPALASHPWFENHQERNEHASEFDEQFMDPWFKERTRAEIVAAAQAVGMPFSYTVEVGELLSDPQFAARNAFAPVDHPVAGAVRLPGAPALFSETPWQPGRAPLLGEHNEEILCGSLGYDHKDLSLLREQGVI
jgi:crotonobetainyl-CoA:carnitine CoA-transferase CaiB-like acyl-CoA transferase